MSVTSELGSETRRRSAESVTRGRSVTGEVSHSPTRAAAISHSGMAPQLACDVNMSEQWEIWRLENGRTPSPRSPGQRLKVCGIRHVDVVACACACRASAKTPHVTQRQEPQNPEKRGDSRGQPRAAPAVLPLSSVCTRVQKMGDSHSRYDAMPPWGSAHLSEWRA